VVVEAVSCLLAETGLLAPVCLEVEKRGLITATPYLVAVLGVETRYPVVVAPLWQAANLFTVVAEVEMATRYPVLAA
jgi:hypothetical protein